MKKDEENKFIDEVNIALSKVLDRLIVLENSTFNVQNQLSEYSPHNLGGKVKVLENRLNNTNDRLEYINNDLKLLTPTVSNLVVDKELIYSEIGLMKKDIQELQESIFDRKNYKTINIKGESDVTDR